MKQSDYSLIPTFVAVVEEKNYTKAAKRLGISQSAVSQGVIRLRDVFKDALFIRGSHGVEPTKFALDIYPTLANSVENIAYMLPEFKKFEPLKCNKEFVISTLSVFGYSILPELAALMSREAPLASVKVEPLSNQDQTNTLRSQYYDLLVEVYSELTPQLNSKIIMEDTLCVICRKDHPRLNGDTLSTDEFLHERHVTLSQLDNKAGFLQGRGLKDERLLSKRKVAWKASSIMEMLPVVERNEYLALLPKKLVGQYINDHKLKQLEVNFLQEPIKIAIYWHSSRTNDPSHKWFREMINRAAKKYLEH